MKALMTQLIKFGGVGVLCTGVEYVLLILMESALGIDLMVATGLSFFLSTVLNYILSIKFVFKVNNGRGRTANGGAFVVMSAVGWVINQLIMMLGALVLGHHMDSYYMLVKVLATALVMVYNFISRKLFLERPTVSEREDQE